MSTLTYSQTSGEMHTPEGELVAKGWAGRGEGKNSTVHESVRSTGPLPRGLYKLGAWEDYHKGLGPMVVYLHQVEGETFGRDGFFIHGASMDTTLYGQESKGCIVIPRAGREKVKALDPSHIRVVE